MNLPKQSAPVSRDAIPGKDLNQSGVTASLGETEFNRIFGRRGTCKCEKNTITRNGRPTIDINPISQKQCNPGFLPQCDRQGNCQCKKTQSTFMGGILG
ncbi:hypothetical protein QT971_17675 [Microcoleus sp. herbarium19]|uniref:hypothetical protein n=1 Tax=unclassified Microcoleus TaxID=2642155 RepID=UPI002FD501FE